jgi:haloalkane dehalogenase
MRQNQAIMDDFYAKWDKPFLTAFGDSDPVTKNGEKVWQRTVPGAKDQPHSIVKDGAHFIQEDQPEELVEKLKAFIEAG